MRKTVTEELLRKKRTLYRKYSALKTKKQQMVFLWGKYHFNFSEIGDYYGVSRQYIQRIVKEETGYRECDKPVFKKEEVEKETYSDLIYRI